MSAVQTLRDFISEDPRLEVILNRYQYDPKFGMEFHQSFDDRDIAFMELLVRHFDTPETLDLEQVKTFPLEVLFSYLKNTHTYYLEKRLFEIDMSIERVKQIYGNKYPVFYSVKLFWVKFIADLQHHIQEEEDMLFPLAESLFKDVHSDQSDTSLKASRLTQLNEILEEHEDDDLEKGIGKFISFVKNNYPELKGLLSFKVLILQLETFQHDLEIHRRVEEEAFIPMLVEILNA
ncbi:MAG: hypothetical protein AAGC85_02975 [Bacteroidota bacterium]